jgi:hypothetical protein
MIVQVFLDMIPFMTILIITILQFAIFFLKLDQLGEEYYYKFDEDFSGDSLYKGFHQTWSLMWGTSGYFFKSVLG